MMSLRTLAPALLVCAALSCVCAATRAEDGFLEEPNDYSDVMDMAYTYPPRTTLGEWPTDHHDAQNSGRSPVYFNVSEYNGACQTKVAEPSPNSFFASCGATSSDGKLLFIGE